MDEEILNKTYEEIVSLKDLFARRLIDDKMKTVAIAQMKEQNDSLVKLLNEKILTDFVNDLILVLDRIEKQESIDELTKSVADEITELLARREYNRITDLDEFNPLLHNAIGTVEATESILEKSVVKVVRSGYYCREKVFRPADVIVAVRKADRSNQ